MRTRLFTAVVCCFLLVACGPRPPTATPVATPVLVAPTTLPNTTPVPPTATPVSTAPPTPTPLALLDGRGGGVIAFTCERGGNADIYLMNADGSNQRQLTHNDASVWMPTWSPAGTEIAFTSARDGNREIHGLDTAGTNLRRLTNNPMPDDTPAWRPLLHPRPDEPGDHLCGHGRPNRTTTLRPPLLFCGQEGLICVNDVLE